LKCPECGRDLDIEGIETYGIIFVCRYCGILIIKFPEYYKKIIGEKNGRDI